MSDNIAIARKMGLTRAQQEVLSYISNHIDEYGHSPRFEEIKTYLGLKSKSGVHRLIYSLKERGFVDFLPHKARSIIILKSESRADLVKAFADLMRELKPHLIATPSVARHLSGRIKSFYGLLGPGLARIENQSNAA